MPDLPLAGVLGAAVGVAVGLIDYAVVAGLVRRAIARAGSRWTRSGRTF